MVPCRDASKWKSRGVLSKDASFQEEGRGNEVGTYTREFAATVSALHMAGLLLNVEESEVAAGRADDSGALTLGRVPMSDRRPLAKWTGGKKKRKIVTGIKNARSNCSTAG